MQKELTLRRRAAQYVRMSTEHQQYSTAKQSDQIPNYAARKNMEIVRIYAYEGKSRLNIGRREGVQPLLADV
jgi:DNA invertase Pin-like site-specific DNA recombinase